MGIPSSLTDASPQESTPAAAPTGEPAPTTTPPETADTLDMALAVALVETLPRFIRALKQSVEQREGIERLTMPQLQCLQAVAAKGATLAARLAEQMGVTAPTMTTRIDALAERGLITRRPDPLNRRQVWLAITPTGRDLLTRYNGLMEQRVRELLTPLTPEQKERLLVAVGDIGSLLDGATLREAHEA